MKYLCLIIIISLCGCKDKYVPKQTSFENDSVWEIIDVNKHIFYMKPSMAISPIIKADRTFIGSVLKPSCKLPPHAHNFISLYRKNGISVTPLNCALKALTFALKDSAFALVALLTKKLSMVS